MGYKNKILLIGNIKEDPSISMKIYLNYLKKLFPNSDVFEPSCGKLKIQLFKNIVYPFIIPKGYDIYHIIDHSYAHLAYFLPKYKTIITCHDLIPLKFPHALSFKSKIFFKYYSSGLKRAKKIITVSQSTKKDVIDLLNISPKKIEVIYPIEVDRNIFRKLDKNKLKKRFGLQNKFILFGIGSVFYKNNLLILKTLKELIRDDNDFIFLKVGKFNQNEQNYIEKNNLKKFIVQKIGVSKNELVKLYNVSDILLFPSIYEGFGIPPLEAMACEIPVIVSNASSLPEIVNDAAIKINPNSTSELSLSIKSIRSNKKLKSTLIKKGLRNLKRFSSKNQKNQLSKIYQLSNS